MAELAGFYLEIGDKETARKLAIESLSVDNTVLESYTVLYKSYLEEEPSSAGVWLTKYLVNSNFSVDASVNSAREKLKKEGLDTSILNNKDAAIYLCYSGSATKPVTLQEFKNAIISGNIKDPFNGVYLQATPFHIEVQNGVITRLEQQYTP